MTVRSQSQHPEKPGHMSFHIKILGSARQGETQVLLWYQRSARGTRNGHNVTHSYMVSRGLILEWCVPCVPSCLKIYLCYGIFPLLNSSFTILFSYFCSSLCFLSAPNRQHSHFSLHDFTIKSLYLERKNQTIVTPQNSSQKFVSTSYFAHTA